MQPTAAATRTVSAALFGNEKMAEVVLSLADRNPATAQEVSDATHIQYTLVRDVLKRLDRASVTTSVRTGGTRSALYYSPADGVLWAAVVELARAIRATRK